MRERPRLRRSARLRRKWSFHQNGRKFGGRSHRKLEYGQPFKAKASIERFGIQSGEGLKACGAVLCGIHGAAQDNRAPDAPAGHIGVCRKMAQMGKPCLDLAGAGLIKAPAAAADETSGIFGDTVFAGSQQFRVCPRHHRKRAGKKLGIIGRRHQGGICPQQQFRDCRGVSGKGYPDVHAQPDHRESLIVLRL